MRWEPNLTILGASQRRLWPALVAVPEQFVLFGGTAIALQLGHRASVDFDFIGPEEFDPDALYDEVTFLHGSKPIQKSASTLTCVVDVEGPVQVSFFGAPKVQLIEIPVVASDIGLNVASLLDLAGMKAAVVQKRAEARDYIDVDALIQIGKVKLPSALAAARALYGPSFSPGLTLKSLSYFGDGSLHTLPREIQDRLVAAVRLVDLDHLPSVTQR